YDIVARAPFNSVGRHEDSLRGIEEKSDLICFPGERPGQPLLDARRDQVHPLASRHSRGLVAKEPARRINMGPQGRGLAAGCQMRDIFDADEIVFGDKAAHRGRAHLTFRGWSAGTAACAGSWDWPTSRA